MTGTNQTAVPSAVHAFIFAKKYMTDQLTREFSQIKSLLLNLPHGDVGYFGALLSNFCIHCEKALDEGADPVELVEKYLATLDSTDGAQPQMRLVLARFVQFIEREVALLDALEESSLIRQFDPERNADFEGLVSWITREKLQGALDTAVADFSLRIVLTAHPTEFYPTVIQRLIRELSFALAQKDADQIDLLVMQLSKTSFRHRQRISPEEEADRLIGYLRDVFFQALPTIEAQLHDYLQRAQTSTVPVSPASHPLVVMGFWPGGDRDGNPYITTQVTLNILRRLRLSVFECYIQSFTQLNERMTFTGLEEMQERILARLHSSAGSDIDDPAQDCYREPGEFLADLQELHREVIERHQGVFADRIEPLLTAVRCFGFHFASMDLRQDAPTHRRLLAVVADDLHAPGASGTEMTDELAVELVSFATAKKDSIDRPALLRAVQAGDDSEDKVLYETALLMTRIGDIHRYNGVEAMHRYIISNTTAKGDCLILLSLLRLFAGDSAEDIDIVPLFESIEDLKNAVTVIESLFTDVQFGDYLEKRDRQMTIMLGFSDGTKDGGYLAGSGRILFVKQELSALAEKYSYRINFFDGRGGPPGRGGGSVTDYYASMGPLVQSRQIQLTIQGQTVSSSFSSIPSAVQTISGYVATGLENRVLKSTGRLRRLSVSDRELLGQMIDDSHSCYRQLIERDDFIAFLTGATPFPYFALANHSSRPSRRKGKISLDNIRAISYVASWNQMKLSISGYYGFGYALERAADAHGIDRLQQLYAQSRFFKALVTDSLDVLERSDVRFTSHFARDESCRDIYAVICAETERSRRVLNSIRPAGLDASSLVREELQRPAVWLQQFCIHQLKNHTDDGEADAAEMAKFYQDMIVKLMAIIINAGRNSA